MRVFVTGATGFVGSAVVKELIGAGHSVLGLARTEAAVAALSSAGAEPYRGSLEDLDSLRSGAAAADGVIHTAFNHDFSRFKDSCEEDRSIIAALADPLGGSDRPLIVTSGTALLPGGQLALEHMSASGPNPRIATEQAVDAAVARGVRASVIRLSPSTHGDGDHGFVPRLIAMAREKGEAAYIGDGRNRWPGVHRLDAASLYRLALEKGVKGAHYHAVGDTGVPFREIAEVIGRRLGVPVVSKNPEQAAAYFNWFTHFASLDNPASSAQTREQLGWQPIHPGLIADIDRPAYFSN